MPSIVKPLSFEEEVTTASNVSSASLVRAYAAADAVVQLADSEGTALASFTIPAGRVEYIEKRPTDVIASTSTLLCSSVAYNT